MRYSVEPWSPAFGSPNQLDESDGYRTTAELKLDVELPVESWRPLPPNATVDTPPVVLLVDGVRRIDAYLWAQDGEGNSHPAVAASYAAGVVRCDLRRKVAEVVHHQIRRALFTAAPGATPLGEYAVQPEYLAPDQARVVTGCRPGERSPIFFTGPQWPHYSWYLRLPGHASHPWAGMVLVQGSPDLTLQQATALADRSTATLPRFASTAYKDPRAPQNLVPIAGLERRLRSLLGDSRLLHRTLTKASAA